MSDPTPGENGIPYTHREIFLTSPYSVGRGLGKFGGIDDPQLNDKDTFKQVVNDLYTLHLIRSNTKVWEALLKSKSVKQYAKSEFVSEYIAKQTSLPVGTYRNIADMMKEDNLKSATKDDIRLILGVDDAHRYIWNNPDIYNNLLKSYEVWMDFYPNLSTFGDPLPRMDEETKVQLGLYAIGEFGKNPYNVYNQQTNIDVLLKSSNDLGKRLITPIDTNHPSWIDARPNSRNTGHWDETTWGSTDNWRDSNYTYPPGIYFMRRSMRTREMIAQSHMGINDPNFTFLDLFNGSVVDNFWESSGSADPINQLDAEFFREAKAPTNEQSASHLDIDAHATISGGSTLTVSGSASADYYPADHAEISVASPAKLVTERIDVSDKSKIVIDLNSVYGETSNHRDVSDAEAKIGITDQRTQVWKGTEPPRDSVAWNIGNEDTIRLSFSAEADANAEVHSTSGSRYTPTAHIDISNVTFL